MTAIRVHFDGKVFVPDAAVNLPEGTLAQVLVIPTIEPAANDEPRADRRPLAELAAILDAMPDTSDLPPDYAMELDHYLYGTPKRGQG
jgi:hypothetical protein